MTQFILFCQLNLLKLASLPPPSRGLVWETDVCRGTIINQTATFSQQKKLTTEAMPTQGQMNFKPQLPNAQMSESVCDAIPNVTGVTYRSFRNNVLCRDLENQETAN